MALRVPRFVADSVASAMGPGRRAAGLALFDQGVVSATSFLSGVIIARATTQEEFGLYAVGLPVVLFLANAQTALISTPYTVYRPRLSGEEVREYAGSTLVHQGVLAFAAAAALAAAALVMRHGFSSPRAADLDRLSGVVAALAAAIGFMLLREYVRRLLFAHLRMGAAFTLDLSVSGAQLAALWGLWRSGALSAPWAFLAIGGACAVFSAAALIALAGHFAPRRRRLGTDLRRNWSLGRWMLASSLAGTAGSELYPWFLTGFHGAAAAGVMSACRQITFVAHPFLIGMTNFLDPKAATAMARGPRALDRLMARSSVLVIAVMLVFFCGVAVAGGWAVRLVYGAGYAGYGGIVALIGLRHLLGASDLAVNSGLLALERGDVLLKSFLLSAGVALMAGVPLVYRWGVPGAAWAMVLGTSLTAAYRIWSYLGARAAAHTVGPE